MPMTNERTQVKVVEAMDPQRFEALLEAEIARDDRIVAHVAYSKSGPYDPHTAVVIFNATNPGGRKK
jgi:hypothetical protein